MLLSPGDRLVTKTGAGPTPPYNGKKFPTYFRLKKSSKEVLRKVCPINKTVRVEFETDAENDYFSRSDSPGSIAIEPAALCEHSRLWNGEYTTRFHAPDGEIGSLTRVNVSVTDVTRDSASPFASEFDLQIGPVDISTSTSHGHTGKQPNTKGTTTAPRVGLPVIQEVRREQWADKFNEFSALRIKNDGKEGYDFAVNMDNAFLLTEMARGHARDKSLVKFWFKYGLALCALGVLQGSKQVNVAGNSNGNGNSNGHSTEDLKDSVDLEQIGRFTDGLARVIVPVIRSLYRGPQPVG